MALRAGRAGVSAQAAGRRVVEVASLFCSFFCPAAVVAVDVVDKSGKVLPVSVVFDPAIDNPAMRIVPTVRAGDCAIDGLGAIAGACKSRCSACKNTAGADGCQQDRQNTFLHFQSSFLIRVSSVVVCVHRGQAQHGIPASHRFGPAGMPPDEFSPSHRSPPLLLCFLSTPSVI